jgi:D-alanyl-D-alanine dipeptidase
MPSISLAEPVTQLKRVKIVENGEPLVDFLDFCPKVILDRPRFNYRRETVVRRSVAERLSAACDRLPRGYKIAVIEGWRAPVIQKRMYLFVWNRFKELHPDWSVAKLRRVVNQFSAPMDLKVPPPHTTGAALDLALVDENGNLLDMSSPYDSHDPKGFYLKAPDLSPSALLHRTILSEAVIGAGITNYPSEFWHYSYGDQGWAYRGSEPFAIYGAITPIDWSIDPNDSHDGPLTIMDTLNPEA